jgi:hypothetical protein
MKQIFLEKTLIPQSKPLLYTRISSIEDARKNNTSNPVP